MNEIGTPVQLVTRPSSNTGTTVSGTTGTALPTPDNDVVAALIMVETADVRMRFDGTTPTTTGVDGSLLLATTTSWMIHGRDIITAISMVPVSDDAWVSVAYIKAS